MIIYSLFYFYNKSLPEKQITGKIQCLRTVPKWFFTVVHLRVKKLVGGLLFEPGFEMRCLWNRTRGLGQGCSNVATRFWTVGDLDCLLCYPNVGAGIRLECRNTLSSDIIHDQIKYKLRYCGGLDASSSGRGWQTMLLYRIFLLYGKPTLFLVCFIKDEV